MIKKNSIDALKRADRALIGAFVLMLITASAAFAYNPPADEVASRSAVVSLRMSQPKAFAPVAVAAVVAPASVRVIPAPAIDAVAAVKRVIDNEQTQCLAQALYYEARGEGVRGEKAVAEVVFNRVHSRLFPHSICGVIFEGASIEGGCQFSFTCNGEMHVAKSHYDWTRARVLAGAIMAGVVKLDNETEGATFYHADYVDPDWDHLVRTVQIGNHIFYRRASRRALTSGA
jgi:hypothetical protein